MPARFYIRPLAETDLDAISRLHVGVWQSAYEGIMPDAYLQGLEPAEYRKRWADGFARHRHDPLRETLLALDGDTIAGFLSYGPARDDDRAGWTEIYAINCLQPYWGHGAGHALFTQACEDLRLQACRETYLWVLQDNRRALAAYQRWGGQPEQGRTKNIEIGGVTLIELSIRFSLG